MTILIAALLCAVFIPLLIWKSLMFSNKFRIKRYYKLTDAEIDEITAQEQTCQLVKGLVTSQGKQLSLRVKDDKILIHAEGDDSIITNANTIRTVESNRPTWLTIHFSDRGTLTVSFAASGLDRALYGNDVPFSWQPHAKQIKEADRKALAFLCKIKQLQSRPQ